MRTLTSDCKEKRGQPMTGGDGLRMRCAPVADHLALAVIKLGRERETLTPVLSDCLREIAGVFHVQVDSTRSTIQILYDGKWGTMRNVHRFLVISGTHSVPGSGRKERHARVETERGISKLGLEVGN